MLVLDADADGAAAPDPDEAWTATRAAWSERLPELPDARRRGTPGTPTRCMQGLTSGGGGMVAAATMSLPERAGQGRNYDYRYVWIRDQCFAGQAVAAAGPLPLMDDAVRLVTDRLLADGAQLSPAYTVTGDPVPDETTLDLPGYPGGADIVGNWVNHQFQLDAFGEALLLLASAADHDHLNGEHWRAAEIAVARDRAALARARRRRVGARSRRLDPQPVDLRRRAAADRGPPATRPGRAVAGARRRDRRRHRRARAAPRRATGSARPPTPRVDAALLLPGLRGARARRRPADDRDPGGGRARSLPGRVLLSVPPRRPPARRRRGRVSDVRVHDVARLRSAGGSRSGRRAWFERNRTACGSPGLLTEEYDVRQRQLRGNLPQAFVHALLLECAVSQPVGAGRGDPGSVA